MVPPSLLTSEGRAALSELGEALPSAAGSVWTRCGRPARISASPGWWAVLRRMRGTGKG